MHSLSPLRVTVPFSVPSSTHPSSVYPPEFSSPVLRPMHSFCLVRTPLGSSASKSQSSQGQGRGGRSVFGPIGGFVRSSPFLDSSPMQGGEEKRRTSPMAARMMEWSPMQPQPMTPNMIRMKETGLVRLTPQMQVLKGRRALFSPSGMSPCVMQDSPVVNFAFRQPNIDNHIAMQSMRETVTPASAFFDSSVLNTHEIAKDALMTLAVSAQTQLEKEANSFTPRASVLPSFHKRKFEEKIMEEAIKMQRPNPIRSKVRSGVKLNAFKAVTLQIQMEKIISNQSKPTSQVTSKPCNCKKSKCLKMYCECFARGYVCGPECNCCDCCNTSNPDHQDLRRGAVEATISKDVRAFQHKQVLFEAMAGKSEVEIPAVKVSDSRQAESIEATTCPKIQLPKGCHCKKSHCRKKYCECFQAGIECGDHCKCDDCQNCEGKAKKQVKGRKGEMETVLVHSTVSPINSRRPDSTAATVLAEMSIYA